MLSTPIAIPATFTAQNDIKYVVDATSVGNKKVAQTVKICLEISMKWAELCISKDDRKVSLKDHDRFAKDLCNRTGRKGGTVAKSFVTN